MIRSMTGYGRGQEIVDGLSIVVEIKSVNHRYFEYPSSIFGIGSKIKNSTCSPQDFAAIDCAR